MQEPPHQQSSLRPLLSKHPPASSRKRTPSPNPPPRKRANLAAVACDRCRRKKIKCTGQRPKCSGCVKMGWECQYALTAEERLEALDRKWEHERRLQQSEKGSKTELFDLVRTLPEHEALAIYQRIRRGHHASNILQSVRDGDLLLQLRVRPETRFRYETPYIAHMPAFLTEPGSSPYLGAMVYEAASLRFGQPAPADRQNQALESIYLKPFHAAELIEPRLAAAKPSLWTNVSSDDELMRSLIAAYFRHEYHTFPVFHKDYFLEDMGSSRNESRCCCSSLLVNAVLARGCFCYSRLPDRSEYWSPQSLAYLFLAEARRLWEFHVVNRKYRNLTTAQSAIVLNFIYNVCALDKLGTHYGAQGFKLAYEIELFNGSDHIESKRDRDARNFTAWCLYNVDTVLSWQFFRPPLVQSQPNFTLPDPERDAAWYSEMWVRYPGDLTIIPYSFPQVFKCISDFRVILHDLEEEQFRKGQVLTLQKAREYALRLRLWYDGLTGILSPRAIAVPAHFFPHVDYFATVAILLQPFVESQWNDGRGMQPSQIVADANRNLQILLRLYYLRHGFEGADIYLVSPLGKMAFMALRSIHDGLSTEELDNIRSSLLLAVKGIRDQGQSHYLAKTIYRLVTSQLRPAEAKFLQDVPELSVEEEEHQSNLQEIQARWSPSNRTVPEAGVYNPFKSTSASEVGSWAVMYGYDGGMSKAYYTNSVVNDTFAFANDAGYSANPQVGCGRVCETSSRGSSNFLDSPGSLKELIVSNSALDENSFALSEQPCPSTDGEGQSSSEIGGDIGGISATADSVAKVWQRSRSTEEVRERDTINSLREQLRNVVADELRGLVTHFALTSGYSAVHTLVSV
ncbi:hypothetical protein PG991_009045 [Apiospora marii]|uniref:Zn(2)-C6 fungal-type domain-containing protein n=1 Tax=Apiospora marii TaxID=335849 RepID=A0ABR1RJJ0_9PEZI